MDAVDLAGQVHAELLGRSSTVAVAESLTGGDLAARLTAAPGASATVLGGVVSAECAEAMAVGVRGLLGADWALATTGVAGPDRQEDKPVGTVFLGVAGPGRSRSVALSLSGDRKAIREQTCTEAMKALLHDLC